jgi:ketosteroid isomerase-like protein
VASDQVGILRRSVELWNRRAWNEYAELVHPDVVVVGPAGWPDGGRQAGREDWLRQITRLVEDWEQQEVEIEDLHEAGYTVLVSFRWKVSTEAAARFETTMWCLYTFSREQVAGMWFFGDEAQAQQVELVQRTAGYWNRRAWPELEADLNDDLTVVPPDGWPEGDTLQGWPEWQQQIERLKDSWEEERVDVADITPAGEGVLVKYRWTTRGKDSGITFETPMWCLFTFRDGLIQRMRYFMDESLAREAARRPE